MFKHICRLVVLAVALGAAPAALADFKCPKMTGIGGLKLTAKDNHLSLSNNLAICAEIDDPLKIRIQNPKSSDFQVKAGDVTAVQKSTSPVVISGSNIADKNYLVITVKEPIGGFTPDDLGGCGDGDIDDGCAGFDIMVAGLGKLDPKVRVVDNNVLFLNLHAEIVEVFEDLGVTLDEVNEIFRLVETDMD